MFTCILAYLESKGNCEFFLLYVGTVIVDVNMFEFLTKVFI